MEGVTNPLIEHFALFFREKVILNQNTADLPMVLNAFFNISLWLCFSLLSQNTLPDRQ
jgi:hypothetical protein